MDTKRELLAALAEDPRVKSKAAAEGVLDALGEVVAAALAEGQTVRLPKIGKLVPYMAAPRRSRHPRTGDLVETPARPSVSFRAADALRAKVREESRALA